MFDYLTTARDIILLESHSIEALSQQLDQQFAQSCELILNCSGRVILIGIGKSGHIARKVAATLASTGTTAFFIHPSEAIHGDMGMITTDDVVILISYSGETPELTYLVPHLNARNTRMIAITGNSSSSLAQAAHYHLNGHVNAEACPHNLAPTNSTTAALVLGDALAISLLQARGFSSEDFARNHPGGSLGKRLLLRVKDLMHQGDELPFVSESTLLADAIIEMSTKRLGIAIITDNANNLIGIFTDGDLRRTIQSQVDLTSTPISTQMTKSGKSITSETMAIEALNYMRSNRITTLPVIDHGKTITGLVHIHDLLQAGLSC